MQQLSELEEIILQKTQPATMPMGLLVDMWRARLRGVQKNAQVLSSDERGTNEKSTHLADEHLTSDASTAGVGRGALGARARRAARRGPVHVDQILDALPEERARRPRQEDTRRGA